MNENLKDIFARLAAPFHPDDIEWRAGATNSDKTKALALAYITSRAVMDRLDNVVGPENWKDEYAPGPDGGVVCGLSLRLQEEWITKWDGAENTDFEAVKGGLSDAFKRAGYKWGIGRYLYKLESQWVACELHGKTIVLKTTPPLPSWALPNEWVAPSGAVVSRTTPAPNQKASEREQQILTELGFGSNKPSSVDAVPVSVSVPASKGNGSNGNGSASKPQASAPNGKKPISWGAAVVQAVLKAHLAISALEAVRLLNESGLDANATPEQAVTRLQALRNG